MVENWEPKWRSATQQPTMAKIISPSTSLLFSRKSLFPSPSSAVSTNPIMGARFSSKPNGPPPLIARASSTATAVVPDDIANVLGEVSIFTAAGEPVKFKDLWDQQEVFYLQLWCLYYLSLHQFLKSRVLFHGFEGKKYKKKKTFPFPPF